MSPELSVEAGIPIYWSDGKTTWQPVRNGRLEEGLRQAVVVQVCRVPAGLPLLPRYLRLRPVGWIVRLARSWRRRRDRRKPF